MERGDHGVGSRLLHCLRHSSRCGHLDLLSTLTFLLSARKRFRSAKRLHFLAYNLAARTAGINRNEAITSLSPYVYKSVLMQRRIYERGALKDTTLGMESLRLVVHKTS